MVVFSALVVAGTFLSFGLGSPIRVSSRSEADSNPFLSNDNVVLGYQTSPEISHSMGMYSPFYSLAANTSSFFGSSNISTDIPSSCRLTFVQGLSRHGARYPTSKASAEYAATISKIQMSVSNSSVYQGVYSFLANYSYDTTLGRDETVGELTAFGQQELVNSGAKFWTRYGSLAPATNSSSTPFFRASGSSRVVQSAQNFTQGYRQAATESGVDNAGGITEDDILVISEDDGMNNTLSHGACPAFENDEPYASVGDDAVGEWVSAFTPTITARLNGDLQLSNSSGSALDGDDIVNLMDLCGFGTVADAAASISPFCHLFSADEWAKLEYAKDLDQWYSHGPGNPLGPTNGVGWINELIARLTSSPVVDNTSVNHTLDDASETFPLDRAVYVDFSHDSDITEILSAMGLNNATAEAGGLDTQVMVDGIVYRASRTVPFSARAYVEKLSCDGEEEEFVRVLVNDEVQPLEFCGGDSLGRCTLSRFVGSQSFATQGGQWDLCFA